MNSPVHDTASRRPVGAEGVGRHRGDGCDAPAAAVDGGVSHPGQDPSGDGAAAGGSEPYTGPTAQVRVDEVPLMREAVGTVGLTRRGSGREPG